MLSSEVSMVVNGSWCWTDAVRYYVGQRGGQGAHTGLRCEGGSPVKHAGGDDDDWDDVCGSACVWEHPPFVSGLVSV